MADSSRLSRHVTELFVVGLGVLLALAADNWRESQNDRRTESQYLDRLTSDLAQGLGDLGSVRDRFIAAQAATLQLIESLEDDGREGSDEALARDFLVAARTGFNREQLGPDATYRELVASGQLVLLRDSEVREGVVNYYHVFDGLVEALNGSELVLGRIVSELTGYMPFMLDGRELGPRDRTRIVEVLRDPDFGRVLRAHHARLVLLVGGLQRTHSELQRLLDMLDGSFAGSV